MHSPDLFSTDFSTTPYWLDDAERVECVSPALPASADLVVIGSGYTGLHAALVAARAGRHVVVLESGEIGAGCSTRNGGQISPEMKATLSGLTKRFNRQTALAILREGYHSVNWLGEFVSTEQIDCDYSVCGSFHGAHSPRHYLAQVAQIRNEDPELPSGGQLIKPDELSAVVGTERYFGGVVYPGHGSIHPARYHQGLLQKILEAGATVHAFSPALDIRETTGPNRLKVVTEFGTLLARDVIVATNGYTSSATPWLRRRVIPVGSYMIATEPLPPGLVDRILPTDRMVCDTRKVIYYYRLTPDRSRIVFGGRVSARETDPRVSAPRLHRELCFLFPALSQVRISHSWMGYVAFTFDSLPKCGMAKSGKHGNLHYAMGYCGSGIAASSYFGMRTAQSVVGIGTGQSAIHNLPFPTRPFYSGKPWFLGAAVKYYQLRDRIA